MSTTLPPTPPAPMDEEPTLPPPSLPATSSLNPTAPPPPPTGGPNPYRLIFPDVVTSFRAGRYADVVRVCEDAELMYPEFLDSPTRMLITTPLVLSHFCLNDLSHARFALVRIPRHLQELPLSRALHDVLASLAEPSPRTLYSHAARISESVPSSLRDEPELDVAIKSLVDGFLSQHRTRTASVLSRAYTLIPLSDASLYLGLPDSDLITASKSMSWSYDPSSKSFRPMPTPTPPAAHTNGAVPAMYASPLTSAILAADGAPSTLMQFVDVANGAAKLESVL